MSRTVISLNDSRWQMGQVARQAFAAPNAFDLPAVTEWLPATVPGNVRTDLLALGRIPSPYSPEGWPASQWVENVDWWYRRLLQLDELAPDRRVFARFHGIDYLSALFVNGAEVARHEGMFSHQLIDITAAAHAGPLELAVRLWGSGALPARRLSPLQKLWQMAGQSLYRSWVGIYPNRTATLKCQMSFGWDFAPPIRAMGIWDDVELLITGPVVIEEFGVRSQGAGDNHQPSALHLQLSLDAARPMPVTAEVSLTPANFQADAVGPFRFSLRLPAGSSEVALRCPLPPVALWQPWDRGFPHLYDVTVTLTGPAGRPLDVVTRRTGFRTIEQRGWQLRVNGRREFARGLNWVPADSLPGHLRPADYRRLLTQARDCSANLLRVWGGGLREKSAFYDLCDELGLLVWQEFPFACEFLGAFSRDPTYLQLVARECGDIVRQLAHHPSLAVWCGGNEFSRARNRPLLATLARLVRQFDGTRPFIPTSPGPGDAHNWHVWHGGAPIAAYQQEQAAFLSEFGLQALSMNNEQLTMSNLPAYFGDPHKLARYAPLFNNQLPMANYELRIMNDENLAEVGSPDNSTHPQREIQNSKLTPQNSQLAQAVALQTAIEHMRRRKAEAGGVCLWQFNEPWPAVSWAIIDYFGRPKLAFERLKTWYTPVLVSLSFPVGRRWQPGDTFAADIWLINDWPHPVAANNLHISLTTRHSKFIVHQSPLPNLPADSAVCAGRFSHQFTAAPQWLIATLRHGDTVLSENHYPLGWHDDSANSRRLQLRRWLAHWALW